MAEAADTSMPNRSLIPPGAAACRPRRRRGTRRTARRPTMTGAGMVEPLNMTLYHRKLISLRVLDQFHKLCTQFRTVAD
jgi:hypothetical protein